MKYRYVIFSLFFAVILAASSAWSQDKKVEEGVMDIKSKEFGKHHEHSVRFDHYLHEVVLRCRMCHHDFNVFNNRNEGKGSKCATCHKKKLTKEIPIPLLTA
ncbi:MAG: cytochrome c family protein, partial [Desulfobacterales bacterium]|nr:cytochrome c family protein [Desulfobacterales bacterium]